MLLYHFDALPTLRMCHWSNIRVRMGHVKSTTCNILTRYRAVFDNILSWRPSRGRNCVRFITVMCHVHYRYHSLYKLVLCQLRVQCKQHAALSWINWKSLQCITVKGGSHHFNIDLLQCIVVKGDPVTSISSLWCIAVKGWSHHFNEFSSMVHSTLLIQSAHNRHCMWWSWFLWPRNSLFCVSGNYVDSVMRVTFEILENSFVSFIGQGDKQCSGIVSFDYLCISIVRFYGVP